MINEHDSGNWRYSISTLQIPQVSDASLRSLALLSAGEYDRFVKAWTLLGSGGVLALTRDGDMPLSGAGVCEALLVRSWAARYHAPREMLRLAAAAQEVSTGLKRRDLGKAGVAAMQARTWGELANALRVTGDLKGAADTFENAFDLEDLHCDSYLTMHLLHMRSTLYGAQGNPGFAAELLELVKKFYDDVGDRHLGGRTRVTQSIYVSRAGRKDDALRLSEEGLASIDRERDPALLRTALHNHLFLLLSLGRKQEARKALEAGGGAEGTDPLTLRLRWMEGCIFQALGDLEDSEEALRRSRDGLSSLNFQLFAAMASLDLAATLLHQGRPQDAEAEALAAQKVLLGLENRKEYFGVLMVLEAAFSSGGITAELIERALEFLRCRAKGSQAYPPGS